jgi:Anti-sigma-K factor rskA, C-terminal
VNPQFHDEFIALSALFFAGELTDEEWALLQVHLAYCDDCRTKFEEYQRLHADVIPLMAASAAAEPASAAKPRGFSLEAAEQRLMAQLDAEQTTQEPQRSRKDHRALVAGLCAACLVGISCLLYFELLPPRRNTARQPAAPQNSLRTSVPTAQVPHEASPSSEPKATGLDAKKLQEQLSAAEARYRQSTLTAADATQQLASAQTEWKKTSDERDALRQQLTNAQVEIQSLRAKVVEAGAAEQERVERVTFLEAKLRDLNASLDEKDRMLALDKDFLAHDREIRDLIAARNLYITDIFDVKDNGQTAKPFGRIFYTKDRSLVFYGYDLDKQSGYKQSVAFQAWGSGDTQPDVSLGLFYQDGTQKRWILRFNDTRTLARLNKVFVTVEPQGGSAKPTGKQILMAYLRVQPNHP